MPATTPFKSSVDALLDHEKAYGLIPPDTVTSITPVEKPLHKTSTMEALITIALGWDKLVFKPI